MSTPEVSALGWFVDERISSDAESEVFTHALTAAKSLAWPTDQYSFRAIYQNVSVSLLHR